MSPSGAFVTISVILAFLPYAALESQQPRSVRGRFEVEGFDFRAGGAWRRRVGDLRRARALALRARGVPALAGAGSVSGPMVLAVLPIAFRDVPPPFPAGAYRRLLFSPSVPDRPYTLKGYYEELSRGRIAMDGRVFEWVVADSSGSYYEDGCNGIGVLNRCPAREHNRFGLLLLRTLSTVSGTPGGDTLWAAFDNDGPDGRPNSGDDDGYVDFVTFLQPERDGACAGSVHIWAHRFTIGGWNGGRPFTTRTPWAGHPGEFLKVDDYTMQSAVGGASACDAGEPMPVGTIAHETGHALGLPDLYDTDLSDPAAGSGIGEWGLMGSGNYATSLSPARMEAWSLYELGWVSVDTLQGGREIAIPPIADSGAVLLVPVPGGGEHYLLENRQLAGSDTAQMNPRFARPKGPGLLVWHIDQAAVDLHAREGDNRLNSGPRPGVALVQADGRNDLAAPGGANRGDAGDPFPGLTANRRLCDTTRPAATRRSGAFAGFCLEDLEERPGGSIALRFISRLSLFAPDHAAARILVNDTATSRAERFVAPGQTVRLSADSTLTTADGRTRVGFLSWSNGRPRSHELVGAERPDTAIARFQVSHRLLVRLQGGVALETALAGAGELSTGVLVPEGTRVALRALVPEGAVFAGWSGDSVSPEPELTVTMDRPYDLEAAAAAARPIALEAAARALLGVPVLEQSALLLLDALGNRNGGYDAGDFLAAMRRERGTE